MCVGCPVTKGYEHLTRSVSPHVHLFSGVFSFSSCFSAGGTWGKDGAGANEDTHPDP